MLMSQALFPTIRETPAEAEITSHQLMLRAGLIRRAAPGIYNLLPFGFRAVKKVEQIVREEMNRKGGQELLMPVILPAEPWIETGRWTAYGDDMFRLKDRHGKDFCLAPTHEECITTLVRNEVTSYRQLPLLLYHITNKYRDEVRPRFGVMRAREFIMKDLYSFDATVEGLLESYNKMYDAYCKVFDRCGLVYKAVEADPGAIGGSGSHEFMALADYGEALIAYCDACGFAANVEKAEVVPGHAGLYDVHPEGPEGAGTVAPKPRRRKALKRVPTPNVHTIQDLVDFLDVPVTDTVKTLFCWALRPDGTKEMVSGVVRGDRDLNLVKLKNLLGAVETYLATAEEVLRHASVPVGSAGPVGLRGIRVFADVEVEAMTNFVCGANEEGYHYMNVNVPRDFQPEKYADLRVVAAGDVCPRCRKERLEFARGIEVGQVFKLWTKYSEALGCTFTDENGEKRPMQMGCYGIGITRTVAAVIEQSHDDKGILWPMSVAPYHAVVMAVNSKDSRQMEVARQIYGEMVGLGVDALLDDRDERAGVKFMDADLMGFPYRITVGQTLAEKGVVEIKSRKTGHVNFVSPEAAAGTVRTLVMKALSGVNGSK